MNLSEKELDINERKRKEDMKRELEKVKKRRIVSLASINCTCIVGLY